MSNQKVAVVTGSGRGIGHGIAMKLAGDGFAVAMFDLSAKEQVADNVQAVEAMGSPVSYHQGDLTKHEDRVSLVEDTLKRFGRIDVLVNNAGVAPRERLDVLETTEESFDFVLGVNLRATFFLTQIVAKSMVDLVSNEPSTHPVIVNVSSLSAYTSSPARGEYCISKAGISMVTKLFADRLAEYGIYVYEVRPGIIKTDMTKVVTEKYDKLIGEGLTPIARWGLPEDIAEAVSLFCADKLRFSTGDVLNVDGGFHLRRL